MVAFSRFATRKQSVGPQSIWSLKKRGEDSRPLIAGSHNGGRDHALLLFPCQHGEHASARHWRYAPVTFSWKGHAGAVTGQRSKGTNLSPLVRKH